MKEITDKELLQLQLDILRDVDSFCRKNGIEYFLVGGTGIGAVRHGGYIPWDDDIDIGMTRPNYNKFLADFNGSFCNLRVYAPEINWNYYAPYANVCDTRTLLIEESNSHRRDDIGVKIDIFPYDGVSSDEQVFESMRRKVNRLIGFCGIKRNNYNSNEEMSIFSGAKYTVAKLLLSFIPYSSLQKAIHKVSAMVPYEKATLLEKIVFPYRNNKPCAKKIFESYCDMKFEDLIVRNLKEYDAYLKSVFGDYMQLPPESQREPHHGFTAYWKEYFSKR